MYNKKFILGAILSCLLASNVSAQDQCVLVTVTVTQQSQATVSATSITQTPTNNPAPVPAAPSPANSSPAPPAANNPPAPAPASNATTGGGGETINGQKLLFFDFPFSTETFPNSRVVRDANNKLQLLDPVTNNPLPGDTLQIPSGACQQSCKNGQSKCKPGNGQCEHTFIQCKRACIGAIESDGTRFVRAVPDDQQKILFGPCQEGGKSAIITMQIPKRPFAKLDENGKYIGEFGNVGVACGACIPNNQECVAKVSSFKKDSLGMIIA